MAVIRGGSGSVSWGIVPINWSDTPLGSMSFNYRTNYLKSANDQLRYQIQWCYPGINESREITQTGDLVNVLFNVEQSVDGINWNSIGKIKKARDVVNKRYETGTAPNCQRFTIDISQLVSDQLSYSLCPINKGTWQSNNYGGMNGGLTMQDNVIGSQMSFGSPISNYNVSENGTFRRIRVKATFEILDSEANIVTASNALSASIEITAINSVNQFEEDSVFYFQYNIDTSATPARYRFLTRCPNYIATGTAKDYFKKPVRIDEQAEWLQFYMRRSTSSNIRPNQSSPDTVGPIGIKIVTYEKDGSNNTFYLRDFEDNILNNIVSTLYTVPEVYQNSMFIQNISPDYIINSGNVYSSSNSRFTYPYWDAYTGDTITGNTLYYTATLVKRGFWSPYVERLVTPSYFYSIDRETENIPYGFVRFHWLNSLGGIDSYTAKRDIVEGLTISRNVIERKSGDRTWYQANSGAVNSVEVPVSDSSYVSDTMRGGDIYKGGREVLSVNAERLQSVYTEPLNTSVANWLKEIILSPNVWIEMDTDATARGNEVNPYLRPSTKEYIPVIITNSDIETVNQSEGLVKFNIEYTLAHKVKTQRN